MNRTTELPTTKETTTDPTTIIMGTPSFLVVRKSDAVVVKTQYENSVKKSRQKWSDEYSRAAERPGIILNSRNKLLTTALCVSGPTDCTQPVKNVIFANHTE